MSGNTQLEKPKTIEDYKESISYGILQISEKNIAAKTAALSQAINLPDIVKNSLTRNEPNLNKLVSIGSMQQVVHVCNALLKRFITMNFSNSEESTQAISYDFINDLIIDHPDLTLPDIVFFFKHIRGRQGMNPEYRPHTNIITPLQLSKWLNLYVLERKQHEEDFRRRKSEYLNRSFSAQMDSEKYLLECSGKFCVFTDISTADSQNIVVMELSGDVVPIDEQSCFLLMDGSKKQIATYHKHAISFAEKAAATRVSWGAAYTLNRIYGWRTIAAAQQPDQVAAGDDGVAEADEKYRRIIEMLVEKNKKKQQVQEEKRRKYLKKTAITDQEREVAVTIGMNHDDLDAHERKLVNENLIKEVRRRSKMTTAEREKDRAEFQQRVEAMTRKYLQKNEQRS